MMMEASPAVAAARQSPTLEPSAKPFTAAAKGDGMATMGREISA
jgi:hypothetical protein